MVHDTAMVKTINFNEETGHSRADDTDTSKVKSEGHKSKVTFDQTSKHSQHMRSPKPNLSQRLKNMH